jgi:hypothetical protein
MPGTTETLPSEGADAVADVDVRSPAGASSLTLPGPVCAPASAGPGRADTGLLVAGFEAAAPGLAAAGATAGVEEAGAGLTDVSPAAGTGLVDLALVAAESAGVGAACLVLASAEPAFAAVDAGRVGSLRAGVSVPPAAVPAEALLGGVKNGEAGADGARSGLPGLGGSADPASPASLIGSAPWETAVDLDTAARSEAPVRSDAGWLGSGRVAPG